MNPSSSSPNDRFHPNLASSSQSTSASPSPSPSTSPSSSRVAAIAKLKRAASNRESPKRDQSPNTASPDPPSASNSPSFSAHRHTASEDVPLFQSATLERTASLLARSMAMAKLTGTAPPAVPSFYSNAPLPSFTNAPLPSLETLRERAKARIATEDSSEVPIATSGHPALRRNHTVTGVGGAAQTLGIGLGVSVGSSNLNPASAPQRSPILGSISPRLNQLSASTPASSSSAPTSQRTWDEDEPLVDEDRAAARVNLMRKLSSRRLAPSAARRNQEVDDADVEQFARGLPAATVNGLRARNGSQADGGDRGNRSPVLVQIPRGPSSASQNSDDMEDRDEPIFAHSKPIDDDVQSYRTEATPRPPDQNEITTPRQSHILGSTSPYAESVGSLISRDRSTLRPASPSASIIARKGSEGREQSDSSASSECSDDVNPQATPSLQNPSTVVPLVRRRGSIPPHLNPTWSSNRPGHTQNAPSGSTLPGFSILHAFDESGDEVRRRGSSASSSVAFLSRGGRASSDGGSVMGILPSRNDSLAFPAEQPARLTDYLPSLSPLPSTNGSKAASPSSSTALEEQQHGSGAASSRGGSLTTLETDDDNLEWIMKEKRLTAKVESKRQAAMARSKDGAFPPPDEGYQFPSPTFESPRESLETQTRAPWKTAMDASAGRADGPKALFEKLASSPRDATRPSPFPPSYLPRPLPPGSPILNSDSDPVSPMGSHFAPQSIAIPASAPPLTRSNSSDSEKARWFQAAMYKSAGVPSANVSSEMNREGSSTSTSSHKLRKELLAAYTPSPMANHSSPDEHAEPSSSHSGDSDYESDEESSRADSLSDSLESVFLAPVAARHAPMHVEDLPSSRIIAKLDALLGLEHLDPDEPSPLDNPPRKLLLHAPVLQVVNAHTVKDRHLFLFTDLLLIAKPIIIDDPTTGMPMPSNLSSSFIVKSVVELRQLKLQASDDQTEETGAPKKRHPALIQFVDRFANDPKKAIAVLIQKGGLSSDAATIANLIFRNPDLNRNQVGAYFAQPENRHILRAYIERFRFSGVRIDDALRMFLMAVRLPHNLEAVEYVLGVVAMQWTETNGATGFDPSLTHNLILAIMRLNDALHNESSTEGYLFSPPNPSFSVDDFIASFREFDPRLLVPEDLLTRIYASVRKERIEHASDNAIFSMTPDIEATISPSRLPVSMTYRTPSEPITITIPEPDPKFAIKLHGTDLKFDPPVLSFAKSKTQSFRITGMALGVRAIVLIKAGANAPRYQGLPLNKAFSIERAFMQHKFQVSFTNHLDVKRKYMFSTLDAGLRATWLKLLRERISVALAKPAPVTQAMSAAEAVSTQVLRDVLIAQDEPVAVLSSAAPSPRPNAAAPRPPRSGLLPRSRQGTPTTRAGGPGTLVRSNSVSRIYAAHYKIEAELHPDNARKGGGPNGSGNSPLLNGGSSTMARAGTQEEVTIAQSKAHGFVKIGQDIINETEQNSLLPVVLGFLGSGMSAAPLPMSANGSAFQLPPLPSRAGVKYPQASFISYNSISS